MGIYLEDFEDCTVTGSQSLQSHATVCHLTFLLTSSNSLFLTLPCKTIAELIVSICNGGSDADWSKKLLWVDELQGMAIYLEEYKGFMVPGTAKHRLRN